MAGLGTNFTYEDFYPNHKADIIKRSHTFLKNWFSRHINEYCTELSWHCTNANVVQFTREDIAAKMNGFFKALRNLEMMLTQ